MSKIGDLFVKLGLKKDDYSRGLKEAGAESEGFVSKLKGIGTIATTVLGSIGGLLSAAAIEFARSSQRFGDIWDQTMAGMKAAWNQFLEALTNFDFKELGKRIKNSFDAARNSAAAHDSEFEVMNSINLRKAEMREELAILEIRMRNQNLSNEQRLAAQKKYLHMLEPLYKQEADMRRGIMLADADEYLANAKVGVSAANRANLKSFLIDVAPNEELVHALDAYNQRNSGKKRVKYTAEQERLVEQFIAQHDIQTGAAMASLATHYLSTGDKQASKVVDALEAYYSAAGAFNDETRRVQNMGNTITHADKIAEKKNHEEKLRKLSKEAKAAAKEAAEIAAADAEVNAKADQMVADIERVYDLPNVRSQYEQEMADGLIAATMGVLEQQAIINEKALALGQEFKDAILDGYVEGIQELMDQLAGLSDANPGAIFQALLTPLADMAVQEGKILMASGLGIEAIKTALESLNGVAAIAAGAALIAIGSAAKSGLSALAQGGSAGGYATYGAQGGGTMGTGGASTIATEMTINVTGRLDGRDIVLSGQRTLNQWGR